MSRNARSICQLRQTFNCGNITRLYHVPNPLRSFTTGHPSYGLEKFRPYFPRRCLSHSIPEIPRFTVQYIDDVPVKGPLSRYTNEDGNYETIPRNPGIRRFVWENFQNINRIVQRMKYCGGTFSGKKSFLCVEEIMVLGHRCNSEGRLPDEGLVDKLKNWTDCKSLTEVRAFLGTVGIGQNFIRNFVQQAYPLVL